MINSLSLTVVLGLKWNYSVLKINVILGELAGTFLNIYTSKLKQNGTDFYPRVLLKVRWSTCLE